VSFITQPEAVVLRAPTLATDRLRLRPLSTVAPAVLLDAVRESLDQLVPWMAWAKPTFGLEGCHAMLEVAQEWWHTGRAHAFAIEGLPAHNFLGGTTLMRLGRDWPAANLSYWVRTSASGAGVASAAVALVVPWALAQASYQEVEALVPLANPASRRVCEKAGGVPVESETRAVVLGQASYEVACYHFLPPALPGGRGEISAPCR
jgi:RimJ/RimL family protein N-acetyltransferase